MDEDQILSIAVGVFILFCGFSIVLYAFLKGDKKKETLLDIV